MLRSGPVVSTFIGIWGRKYVSFITKDAMESLTPPILTAIREVRWLIGGGHSMNEAFRIYLESSKGPFTQSLSEWWVARAQARVGARPVFQYKTYSQRLFLELVERGCAGQPTLEALRGLEDEVEKAAQAELDAHLASLPFKVLIPLLIFQFPAYLVLLLGPVLRDLSDQLTR